MVTNSTSTVVISLNNAFRGVNFGVVISKQRENPAPRGGLMMAAQNEKMD